MNQKLKYSIQAADLLWIAAAFEAAQTIQSRLILAGQDAASPIRAILLAGRFGRFCTSEKNWKASAGAMVPDRLCSGNNRVIYLLGALLVFGFLSKNYARGWHPYIASLLPLGFIAILLCVVAARHDLTERRGDGWSFSGAAPRERPGSQISRHPRKCRWK